MTASTEVKALCERLDALAKFTLSEDRANDFRKAKGLIESLSARNAEMVEALAQARQVLAVYQPEGAPTFYMEALWKAEAALDTPSKQLGEG